MSIPRIAVLLSTFNGAKFLSEQLESINKQSASSLTLYVRDDGSQDLTLSILKKYALNAKLTIISDNQNMGPAASFLKLLAEVPSDFDYYAFSDQDDIWYDNKLEIGMNALKSIPDKTPAMYCSCVDCVNVSGKFIKKSAYPNKVGFGNAVVENVAIGCTVIINQPARALIVSQLPRKCIMHDSWCYLVVSCFGEVIFDQNPSMMYRQHAANAIGASVNLISSSIKRVTRLNPQYAAQAAEFLRIYEPMMPYDKKVFLMQFVNAKNSFISRIHLAFNFSFWRQSYIESFLYRLLVLFNKY